MSPASPPLPPSGRHTAALMHAACEPWLLNLADGLITCSALVTEIPSRRVMPAGFHQIVPASSATAADPAYALPRPLAVVSTSAKADASTDPDATASAPPTATDSRERRSCIGCMMNLQRNFRCVCTSDCRVFRWFCSLPSTEPGPSESIPLDHTDFHKRAANRRVSQRGRCLAATRGGDGRCRSRHKSGSPR